MTLQRFFPGAARAAAVLLVLLLALALPACGGDGAAADSRELPRAASRVLLLGIDGLEWSVLRPLLQEGRCPNLAALMQRGSFGRLGTLSRTFSPVVWTSVATGRLPKAHGIFDFLDAESKVFTSSHRRVPALWNIADAHGLSTNLFGWFITWPAEHVRGLVVSGSSSSALNEANWKPALVPSVPDQVWPREREAEVMAIAEEAGTRERIAALARDKVYGSIPAGVLDPEQEEVMQQTLWSLSADATYFEIARRVIREAPADLNLVYLGGTDVVGHRYWRQFRPEGFQWSGSPASDAALARVLPNYYAWADEMVGELVAAAGPDATVLVVSDHGMHAVALDKPDPFHMTGHHMDAPPGVIIAAGPGLVVQGDYARFLETGALAAHGSVIDVAPTVLALLGLPGARDFAGRAYLGFLTEPARAAAKQLVESHDGGFRPAAVVEVPPEMDSSFKEKFNALGYLGLGLDPSEEITVVPAASPR